MTIYIDSREPPKFADFLVKAFPGIEFRVAALKEGDYESDRCLVERKTIADLNGSIKGSKGKPGRLHDQLERLSVHQDKKVVILMLTGTVGGFVTDMRAKCEMDIDPNVLYGEVASITCRYNIMPLWIEKPQEALITMIKLMRKIDEGEWQVPPRRNPRILAAKLLGTSTQQFDDLTTKFGSLHNIAHASLDDMMKVHGIGTAKANRIREVLIHGIRDI